MVIFHRRERGERRGTQSNKRDYTEYYRCGDRRSPCPWAGVAGIRLRSLFGVWTGDRSWKVETQKALAVEYCRVMLDCGYRIDLLVEEEVIVESKAVEK